MYNLPMIQLISLTFVIMSHCFKSACVVNELALDKKSFGLTGM